MALLIAVAAVVYGLLFVNIIKTVRQMRSMQRIEGAERALQKQELAYAEVLKLACDNFLLSSPGTSAHLLRIHAVLEIRREALICSKQFVSDGSWSKWRHIEITASAWEDEVSQRVRDLHELFADLRDRRLERAFTH